MEPTQLDQDHAQAHNGAEVAQSEPQEEARAAPSRARKIIVNALIVVTTLLLVVAVFSVWANRLLFNPDNWSQTSTQLLQNDKIRSTTANYLVDQLYANVNVADLIKSGLPTQLQSLSGPAAGALRNAAVRGTELALERPRVQNLWAQANHAADQTFVDIVNGGKGAVAVNQGEVTLNLGLVLDNVASRIGLPADLSAKLPANVATLRVLKSDQLKLVQDGGNAIRGLALWLTILTPSLYGLAIVLAVGRRRRTLMTVGFAIIVAGCIVFLLRALLTSEISSSLTDDASLRSTIVAAVEISTGILSEIAGACIVVGIPLIGAAWLAGPTRPAQSARKAIAPFLREHAAASYAITLAIMVLIFLWNPIPATGKPAGMIVFLCLALLGTYVLRRQTQREFPDARTGAAAEAVRERLRSIRSTRAQAKTSPVPSAPMPEQLKQLADLRAEGAISDEEYRVAKAQLLHT